MKKTILIFGFLVGFILPVAAQIESPLTNFSLYAGNIYFGNRDGDGTARWAEARLLFGGRNDYRLLSFGGFVNYNEVGSKFNDYLYHDAEWAYGLAVNFGSQYWSSSNEIWGWLNAGLKTGEDRGQIGKYDTRQKDKMLYAFGGVMFKNSMGSGPFFIKKFMVTCQQPLEKSREAYWDGSPTYDTAVNKGYAKLTAENTFCSWPLTSSERLRLEPKITGSAACMFYDQRMVYSLGIGFTLAREYSQEILAVETGVKFDQKAPGNIYSIGVLVNFVEVGKIITNRY